MTCYVTAQYSRLRRAWLGRVHRPGSPDPVFEASGATRKEALALAEKWLADQRKQQESKQPK